MGKTPEPGIIVSLVARQRDVSARPLFTWREIDRWRLQGQKKLVVPGKIRTSVQF